MLTADRIKDLALSGESYTVDFKLKVPEKLRDLAEEVCSFANADGGYVLIGIDNGNHIAGVDVDNKKRSAIQDAINSISPTISCEMYSVNVNDRNIWVIEVPRGTNKPYIYGGSIYVRQGANAQMLRTREDMLNFFRECNSVHYDSIPAYKVDLIEELDKENFQTFCNKAGISGTVDAAQILSNIHAFDEQSGAPKAGAVMCFAKQPQRFYPQSWVHCVRFKGKENVVILDDKRYYGTIHQQYIQALTWIKDKLELRLVIDDAGPHKEVLELPENALREALVNSLSHRDYYETGAVVVVAVYDDRVVISNPGGLLSQVAKNFGHKSLSRNPFIFSIFTRMQLVEQVGSGIPRMCAQMKEMNLPEPIFGKEGMFTITFIRYTKNGEKNGEKNSERNDERNDERNSLIVSKDRTILSVRQKSILEAMEINGHITAKLLAQKMKIPQRTIEREISFLRKNNYIEKKGATKNGIWVVLK